MRIRASALISQSTSETGIRVLLKRLLIGSPILLLLVLVLTFGLGFLSHAAGWHRALWEFGRVFVQQPGFVLSSLIQGEGVATLFINLDFADYQQLLTYREVALNRGASLPLASGADYVTVSFTYTTTETSGAMRLWQGPGDAFAEERWPLQIEMPEGSNLLGARWALLTPAGENALTSWGYLELLRREGFFVPEYHLVHLQINGKPWGLYSFQELPSTQTLVAQGRTLDQVWVFFDAQMYWAAYAGTEAALPGDSFAYAEIAAARAVGLTAEARAAALVEPSEMLPGDESLSPGDPLTVVQSVATQRLQAVARGELSPSQIFDAERMGRFLALTMLWQGTPALDWRALYLAYDPVSQTFEPMGGDLRGASLGREAALPDVFTTDPAIQRAYLQALVELSQPGYVLRLQVELGPQLDMLRLAAGSDLGYPSPVWDALLAHQERMRHILAPPRTVFADVTEEGDALVVRVRNVLPFPVEIVGLDLGERAFLPFDPDWVAAMDARSRDDVLSEISESLVLRGVLAGHAADDVYLYIPLSALPADSGDIQILTQLWGLETQIAVVAE
ncbi:MAG: hypothetical protein JXA33_14850 [Anaerolineae bacterium]|nr:hypothetical protein [Anaerolineae bacterium]